MTNEQKTFPLWSGVFRPEWFDEDDLETYPDPNISVYYFSLTGKDVRWENGFSTEECQTWNTKTTLGKFLEYAAGEGWIVGESFGFPDD